MVLSNETGEIIDLPLHPVTSRELTDCPGHTVSEVGLVSSLVHRAQQQHFGRYNLETDTHTLYVYDLNGLEAVFPSPCPSGCIWKATVDMYSLILSVWTSLDPSHVRSLLRLFWAHFLQ